MHFYSNYTHERNKLVLIRSDLCSPTSLLLIFLAFPLLTSSHHNCSLSLPIMSPGFSLSLVQYISFPCFPLTVLLDGFPFPPSPNRCLSRDYSTMALNCEITFTVFSLLIFFPLSPQFIIFPLGVILLPVIKCHFA